MRNPKATPKKHLWTLSRRSEILRDAKKEAHDFVATEQAESEKGRALLRYVIDLWGERFGLAAGG